MVGLLLLVQEEVTLGPLSGLLLLHFVEELLGEATLDGLPLIALLVRQRASNKLFAHVEK